MKLDGSFDSLDFLKGHAGKREDGDYEMVGSDFLQSIVGKLTEMDKSFLYNLLNLNWNWVDDFIKVTGWIDSFGKKLGL